MKFKVGDIVQIRREYQPDNHALRQWHIVILNRHTSLFTKTTYDILCIELGRTWTEKIGENGLTSNFVKIGEMTEEELKVARMIYL